MLNVEILQVTCVRNGRKTMRSTCAQNECVTPGPPKITGHPEAWPLPQFDL